VSAFYAVVAIGAVLLVFSGVAKLRSPGSAVTALAAVGVPAGSWLVRAGAGLEIAIGTMALVASTWWSCGLVALTYAGFAAFLAVALRTSAVTDCGCFGDGSQPPRVRQVVLAAAVAVCSAAAAVAPARSGAALVATRPALGVLFAVAVSTGAVLAHAVHDSPVTNGQR
jgi:hypothetical protein